MAYEQRCSMAGDDTHFGGFLGDISRFRIGHDLHKFAADFDGPNLPR